MDERHASALYELAPEEFVAAREALAKELVAEGDRAAAKEVRALRRPTVVAWAANQLVRRHPQAVESLLAAGGQLRAAQEGALGGAGGAGLREAMGERRAALDALVRLGAELLGDRAGAGRNELSATLLAASTDPAVGEELRRGRLTREVGAATGFEGFGGGGDDGGPAAAEPAEAPAEPLTPASDRGGGAVERQRAAAERALADARVQAEQAARRLEACEGELAERGEELKVASAEAAALERDLSRARASLTEAQTRASSLEAVVDDLRRETAEATAEVGRAEANWARARR